jgi:hypothetical protein
LVSKSQAFLASFNAVSAKITSKIRFWTLISDFWTHINQMLEVYQQYRFRTGTAVDYICLSVLSFWFLWDFGLIIGFSWGFKDLEV